MTNQIPFSYFQTYVSAYSMSFLHSCQDSQVCSKHIILEFRNSQKGTAGRIKTSRIDQVPLEVWRHVWPSGFKTPGTLDPEVRSSSLACHVVSLDKEL